MGRKLLKKGETPDQFQTELYDKITKIEAQVLQRIQKLKGNSKSYVCQHFSIASPECQPFDRNVNYYDKFWKRFLLNEIGKQNILQFRDQLDSFTRRLLKIQTLFGEWEKQLGPIMKTKRRQSKMEEGDRFHCHTCSRVYRDQQTLMLHIKIKHKKQEAQAGLKHEGSQCEIYEEENEDE